MKIKFLFFFFFTVPLFLFSQVHKYKAVSYSAKFKNASTWGKWSEAERTDILVSINFDDAKIKIYSKETQLYDIVSIKDKITDDEGDDIFSMYCEDADGMNCYVDIYKLHSQNGRLQLYVRYSDMQWLYNLVSQ